MGSYAAPSVGPAGLTINSYATILAYYVAGFQLIYGTNTALGNDSADFQLLSLIALVAADCNSALQLAYNQQSPVTAVGAGLSTVVAVNGLQRNVSTYSVCQVTLTGTAGAVVTNGVIQNSSTGDLWNLPASVTIGSGGTVNVTATAQQTGAITCSASQLTVIVTATAGWTSVTNGSNLPTVGSPVETDAQLRARQAVSTESPASTTGASTIAAILAVPGVTAVNFLENDTGSTDVNGNPGHSITCVVTGGAPLAVATAIYNHRGLGCLMNGNSSSGATVVTESITDPNTGLVTLVSFNTPTLTPIYVIVNAHLLTGGSTATITAIQTALVNYLNSLQAGESVYYTSLIAVAMSVNPDPSIPIVKLNSLYLSLTGGSFTTTADITLSFWKVAQGITADVVVNSV